MAISFGKTIREIREQHDWSLQDMAQILGTTKQALSKYERNERTPKITVAAKFADKLNIPLEQLIGLEEVEEQTIIPKTREAQIIAKGIDKLPQKQRKQILDVVRAMYANQPELFSEKG